ncbi:MAG: hypothetical protein IKM76_05965 [Prevotella sp.]|jgi:hypothetical protein|nr:hypothetical protein [Prevotella sp.]
MKKIKAMLVLSAVAMAVGSCGNKVSQQTASSVPDTTAVVMINRDSTVYGICGDGSAMNTLQLITDVGDTLLLSIAEANERGRCFGGFQSGDRMAVILKNKTVASMVINQSALLGDWVMPNPLDGSSEMGIRIKEGGIAEGIDQAYLTYRSWRLFNGKLEIVAVREGGGDEEEINLYDIVSIGADSLVIKDSEDTYEYSRYKEHHYKVDIRLEDASEDDFRM